MYPSRRGNEHFIEDDFLNHRNVAATVFTAGLLFACSPWASPPLALALGIAFGLAFPHPWQQPSQRLSRLLLQASVVGLGFGMNLQQVLHAGASGFLYTAAGIAFAMVAGIALGRILGVDRTDAFLITVGTAICGGSAIAAVGPITEATEEQMSVSLGTVFLLNSVALLIFPAIGIASGLSEHQFGLWAALAIHDTSSVVGAAAKYGAVALAVGTTVKLARALWIIPVSLATAVVRRSNVRVRIPWFIFLFLLAAVIATMAPDGKPLFDFVYHLARVGLTATLYLIGSNISRESLRRIGPRPLVMGVTLWSIVAALSLVLIRTGLIS